MADIVQQTNQQLMNSVDLANIGNVVGWIIFGVIVIAGGFFAYTQWRNKKIFNKKITVFEIVGQYYEPVYRDFAKTVKLGKGGFEILFLKKMKVYRIGYGGRVGKRDYYFFIGRDGYWYNGMLSAKDIFSEGHVPIVTTNPTMRGQYTALEKQIDALHAEKASFLEKYGQWIAAIAFVLIAGVIMWLILKEYNTLANNLGGVTDKIGQLLDKAGSAGAANSGLVNVH